MARFYVGGEMFFVHSLCADLMSGHNPLLHVLSHHQWLTIPAWFVACHTGVIVGNTLTMCVTHVPIVEVFDFTFLIIDRLVMLSRWWENESLRVQQPG